MKFTPANPDTVESVLLNLIKFLKENPESVILNLIKFLKENPDSSQEVCDVLNDVLDELSMDDFFGTEGQLDPRGDCRD